MKSKTHRVAGVGNIEVQGNTVIKTVNQSVIGTAYQKIPGMLIAIHQAGYERTILRINKNNPYMLRIEDQVAFLKKSIPNISIEKV